MDRLRMDMVVELVQTRRVPFDKAFPERDPSRCAVVSRSSSPPPTVMRRDTTCPRRYALPSASGSSGPEGDQREASQRRYSLAMGLMNGNTDDERHFQVNFGLVHQGM